MSVWSVLAAAVLLLQVLPLMVQLVEILLLELVQHLVVVVEQQMITEGLVVLPHFLLELQV